MMLKQFMLASMLCHAPLAVAYDLVAIADRHVIPGYQTLAETTHTLKQHAGRFCNEQESLTTVQQDYLRAFHAWQAVQHLRFGPIQYISREHRFELWPDKRNSVIKHLTQLMNDPVMEQDTVLDISQKSIAVQGFTALEYLLFRDKTIDEKSCKLINAITRNLNTMSNNLVTDWTTSYRADFVSAANGNDIYESDIELASQLFNSMNTQLEFMVTQKLARPLGENIKKSNGKRAQGWRSDSTLSALSVNLTTIHDLYRVSFANEINNKTLTANIEKAFQQAKQSIETISLPLHQAVSVPAQREHLVQLQQQLIQLQQLLVTTISDELGLTLGFNSLDGD